MDFNQMAKILTSLAALVLCTPFLFADESVEKKREIERIKKQAAAKESELKKYREQEKKISKEISALEDQKVRAQRLKNKLDSDISVVEQHLLSTEDKRAALERSMPMGQGVALEELVNYYLTPS